jgi:hypothetical protein
MKIIENNYISYPNTPLFETPHGFLINTQMYDKTTLQPQRFIMNPLNNRMYYMSLYKTLWLSKTQDPVFINSFDRQTLFIDNQNPDKFYKIYISNGDIVLSEFLTQNNVLIEKIIDSTTFFDSYNSSIRFSPSDIKILYKTKDFILYVKARTRYNSPHYYSAYELKIYDIESQTSTVIESNGDFYRTIHFNYYILTHNNDCNLVYLLRYKSDSVNDILEINLNTKTITKLISLPMNSTLGQGTPIRIGDYFYTFSKHNNVPTFAKFKIDIDKREASSELVDVDLNGFSFVFSSNPCVYTDLSTISIRNKTYIVMITHSTHGYRNLEDESLGIIILDENLKILSKKRFYTEGCSGAMYYADNNTLVLEHEYRIGFYRFDYISKDFVEYDSIPIDSEITAIGFDTNNVFYIQDSKYSIKSYIIENKNILRLKFKEKIYKYNGTNIETSIFAYCCNTNNQYSNKKVKIQLNGPAVFKTNGLQELDIILNEVTEIKIIITGGVKISANIAQCIE